MHKLVSLKQKSRKTKRLWNGFYNLYMEIVRNPDTDSKVFKEDLERL